MILKSVKEYSNSKLKSFSSGNTSLDSFLHMYAEKNDISGYGKTFILEDNNKIMGYFTLCSAQIKYEYLPASMLLKLPKYPIPCIRIARLAVNKDFQNKGYGKELLRLAFLKILDVADLIGIYIVIVDAKETYTLFYEHYGFKKLTDGKLTYFMPIETIKMAAK